MKYSLIALILATWTVNVSQALESDDAKAQTIELTKQEKQWLQQHPEVTVAVSHGWAPVEFLTEEHQFKGISVDYLKLLETKLPIKFKFTRSVEAAQKETADILSAVANPKSLLDSPYESIQPPYLKMPFVIFVRKETHDIETIADLAGRKVAVFRSGAAARALEKNHPEIQLFRTDIADEALAALITGKVDAYIGNLAVINYVARNLGFGNIKIVDETPYGSSIHMAVRQELPELRNIIDKGLKSISDEESNAISRNWVAVTYEHRTDYTLLISIISAAALLIAIFAFWGWKLSQEIKRRKVIESELKVATERAEAANKAKSRFLASMSHELRTPLNAIMGYGQLIETGHDTSHEDKRSAREIVKAGNHLLSLINELLDLSKIESGKLNLELKPVKLEQIIDECVELVASSAKAKRIQIKKRVDESLVIMADPVRLKQVLLNLLSNAIKYNREAGSIDIQVNMSGKQASIAIADTGHGISKEYIHLLFEPFERLKAESTDVEGTGIGLTISRHIVEMMQGTISVRSQVGVGSVFKVSLPLV